MNQTYMNKSMPGRQTTIRLLLLLVVLVSFSGYKAQASESNETVVSTPPADSPYPSYLGINFGTTGLGLHYYESLGRNFGIRIGANFMPFYSNVSGTYNNRRAGSQVSIQGSNVSAIFTWAPFLDKTGFFRSFGINAGAAYFFDLKGEITTRVRDAYQHGDITVPASMIGVINTDITYKASVAPYLGIGLNDIRLDERFSLQLDLGSYYLSKPSVSMEASGLLAGNTGNVETIERNIKDYRFLPRVEVGVSIRLN